jgi:O-antigen/teichoic acid export membrane protein
MSRNLIYSTLSAGSAVLLLLLSTLIARALGQEGWGNSRSRSLAMIGEALMDFGIHQVTIRSIARDRSTASHLFRNSLLKALPGAAMFVAIGAFAFVLELARSASRVPALLGPPCCAPTC